MNFKYIFVAFIICMNISCKQSTIKNQIKQFISTEITIPTDMNIVINGVDSVTEAPILINNSIAKMIIFYDSTLCSPCKISYIKEWDEFIVISKALQGQFEPIFIFSPAENKLNELQISLKVNKLDYPIFIDSKGLFQSQNPRLPFDKKLHTFLVDKNNRVVLVGDPSYNRDLWALYKTTINELVNNDGVLRNIDNNN